MSFFLVAHEIQQCSWISVSEGSMHGQNRLRFVYNHFKSCDQSVDKTSLDFSNIFRAMQSCTMNARVE